MAVKKQSGSGSPRKSTRSAKINEARGIAERQAPEVVSTAQPTAGSARNAVIEGNAMIDPDEVRRRAYELYEERGRQHGFHEQDWHRAEREIRSRSEDNQPKQHQSIPPQKKSA